MSSEAITEVMSARDERLGNTLGRLRDFVSNAGRKLGLSPRAIYNLKLAVDEIATNIVMYAYPDSTDDDLITVTARFHADKLEIMLEDTGIPYDPRDRHMPTSLDSPLDTRELGGLGVYFALNSVDEFTYHRTGDTNHNHLFMYRPLNDISQSLQQRVMLYSQRDRDGIHAVLSDAGYHVDKVSERTTLLKALRDHRYDLLIIGTDIQATDAFRMLKRLRLSAITHDVPLLAIGSDGVYLSRCMELGATDFLLTPLDPVLLELRARITIEHSRTAIRDRIQKIAKHIKAILLSDEPELRFGREMNIDQFLEHVLNEVQGVYNADAGTVYLKEEDNHLHFVVMQTHSLGIHSGGTATTTTRMPSVALFDADGNPNHTHIASHVVHTGEVINITDIYENDRFDFSGTRWFDEHNQYRSVSTLTVPLTDHNDEAVGVLQLINAQDESGHIIPFDRSQQMLVEALSAYTAVILSNYRLLQRQATLASIENDMRVGRRIQRDFMPDTIPEIDGWAIDARFYPAREVAGDFYDIYVVDDYVVMILADVCDKGVGAALFMALIRSLLRAYLSQARQRLVGLPAERQTPTRFMAELRKVVQHTNDYIIEHHYELTMFATLFLSIVHLPSGHMYYINGGHSPTPILRRQKTGKLERLMPTGPAVGMFDDAWFEVKTERLQPGDLLFAFTDGVNDAHNAHGELLGEEDVLAIVQEAEAVDTLLTHITNTVFNQIGSSTQFDDMTFWAISRQGK